MKSRHFLTIAQTPLDDILEIFDVTARQKKTLAGKKNLEPLLAGRSLALLFEKPSLRTRVSFEVAMAQLGGHVTTLTRDEVQLGKRETVADFARVLSRYVDAVAARVFKHEHLEEMARHSSVPVISMLSELAHPCQALADAWTIREKIGRWEGVKIAFIGDGNNVARSLALISAKLGCQFNLCSPEGYRFPADFVKVLHESAQNSAADFQQGGDVAKMLRGADVVYTDVWTSMGQEAEQQARRKAFTTYQLNENLLKLASPGAIVLHCLPAHRGEEITDAVMDGPQSAVIDQAENRLHTTRALLTLMLAQRQ